MPKFFVLPEKISDGVCIIDNEDAGHITRVLRLGAGDTVRVCDSAGFDYIVKIAKIEDKRVICNILSKEKSDTEPTVAVTLYQGIPKGAKMEYIIQKTTELGVTRIVPCKMARCVSKPDDKQLHKKVERWQKIAESAAKQSGRGIIPEVADAVTFAEAVDQMQTADMAFAPFECERTVSIRELLENAAEVKTAAFIIGPEGGFDPSEIEKISELGIPTVTLGKRILRTETAGETVCAVLMYATGNM